MAVVIRMKRTGRKNAPCYRISVADSRAPRNGRTLAKLGLYDPRTPIADKQLSLDVEAARDWIARGAKPSETIVSIFKKLGVFEGAYPVRKPRSRPRRKVATKARTARKTAKKARVEHKAARYKARVKAKRAAKKAAPKAEG